MLCKNCGTACNSTYCSHECKQTYRSAYKKNLSLTCPECGTTFTNKRGAYCSEACNRAAEAKRLKATVASLFASGMTVPEIAKKLRTWPKTILKWTQETTEDTNLDEDATEDDQRAPVSIPKISLQSTPFTRQDELDARVFKACLAGYEKMRKKHDDSLGVGLPRDNFE
jgi:hypothetical protein